MVVTFFYLRLGMQHCKLKYPMEASEINF